MKEGYKEQRLPQSRPVTGLKGRNQSTNPFFSLNLALDVFDPSFPLYLPCLSFGFIFLELWDSPVDDYGSSFRGWRIRVSRRCIDTSTGRRIY